MMTDLPRARARISGTSLACRLTIQPESPGIERSAKAYRMQPLESKEGESNEAEHSRSAKDPGQKAQAYPTLRCKTRRPRRAGARALRPRLRDRRSPCLAHRGEPTNDRRERSFANQAPPPTRARAGLGRRTDA